MPEYTIKEINELERVFLELLDYRLFITASEYAKYYFILRAYSELSEKQKFTVEPPQSLFERLQRGVAKVEVRMRNSCIQLEQTL